MGGGNNIGPVSNDARSPAHFPGGVPIPEQGHVAAGERANRPEAPALPNLWKDGFDDLANIFKPDKPAFFGPAAHDYAKLRFNRFAGSCVVFALLIGCFGVSVFSATVCAAVLYGGLRYRDLFKNPDLFGYIRFEHPKSPVFKNASELMQAVFVSTPDWLIQKTNILMTRAKTFFLNLPLFVGANR